MKEKFLDQAAKNAITGGPKGVIHHKGKAEYEASVPNVRKEIGGHMVKQSFEIEEGEVVKCYINVRRDYGKLPRNANVFLRMRANAAYRKIRFNLIDHVDTVFTHGEIEGTFDLLTTEEAIAAGVHIPKAYRSFSAPENAATVIQENIVIRPELESKIVLAQATVSDGEGNTKTIVRKKRRRNIG